MTIKEFTSDTIIFIYSLTISLSVAMISAVFIDLQIGIFNIIIAIKLIRLADDLAERCGNYLVSCNTIRFIVPS